MGSYIPKVLFSLSETLSMWGCYFALVGDDCWDAAQTLSLETTEIVDHVLLGPMDEAIWRQVKVGYLRYHLVRRTSPVTVGRYVNSIAFPLYC